ncbi:Type I restriction-modification system specificity determinant [Aliarcobacter butzleri RM4018]|uniref:Type I restriction-modification system specificity determinant n=1 Tax=Aliarcobacter butzleri (strain RM4018) TaxID=367737 RepID=A8EVJ0_ALIB4|nr:restriction endonuclease subunit S [Aliarcobacter butzleri]ABV67963.1 Type I restriction-modification system specificity determinant [Aliarcobacter butzleri RM4018]GGT78740.1 hypothetical protein GCM10007985_14000 [Aliarcobacter butzleri]SNV31370.1 EcoKI restriction-modification system protein HsdS [Aliarcobacter butzleri]
MIALLDFVKFNELSNWSVAHLLQNHFNYNKDFELVKIGTFLKRNKTQIIVDDNTTYKRVTIKLYNNGVFLRDTEIGKNIGTKKQFSIKEGQFLLSKIDARNGAFGIATNEVDGAIITADFLAFDIDTSKINPDFLVLITTTKKFMQFAQSASSGTTGRQRIDESKFLNTKIPLPKLDIQKQIVENYQNKINLASEQGQKAENLEKNIEEYLYTELGIIKLEILTKDESSVLKFVTFKDMINCWGYENNNQIKIESTKYKVLKLINICNIGSGGTPSRNYPNYYINGTIPWIKTGEVRDALILNTEESITEEALQNSNAKIYPKDSLIVAMYGATAGRTAKLGIEASTNQACAILHNFDLNKININFIWFYLMTQLENFKLLTSGSAQPNLNADKIKNYQIPIPPIEMQNKIANNIEILKNEIKILNEQSEKNKKLALEEFEREVFNEA